MKRIRPWLERILHPDHYQRSPDVREMQVEAEQRRSDIMARLRALEMRYEAASRSGKDGD